MNIIQSSAQFLRGMQNIESDIITRVRNAGGAIDNRSFRWNTDADWVPPPESVELEIKTPAQTLNAIYSRQEVQDSWQGVRRADVVAFAREVATKLTT